MVTFIDNFILGIALALPLGPVTLEIARRGLKHGLAESLKAATGSFAAELTYFSLVYLGLAQFAQNTYVKYILGLLGVGFLLKLGYDSLKEYFSHHSTKSKSLKTNPYLAGFSITFFNPSNFFMWAGIIGGFFVQNTSLFVSSGVLYGIFLSLFGIAFVSGLGRKHVTPNGMKYVSLVAGLFLIFYGLRLFWNLFN